jgi:pyridoxamine 5'-phosphate oxidase
MNPDLTKDPLDLLDTWISEAESQGVALPEAMTLATVDSRGLPSARIVLYKGRSGDGLRFFTNYESCKGQELERVPHAALVFHWASLERQVRVTGTVEKLSAEESDAYFASRPRESQLGAWASPQSRTIESRAALEAAVEAARQRFGDGPVPRPPHWGGYRVVPSSVELWLGRGARVHDRYLFVRSESGWQRSRLAP